MKVYQGALVCAGLVIVLGYQVLSAQQTKQPAPAQRAPAQPAAAATGSAQQIERGRYMVEIGGCNDCHTAGYANAGGEAKEADRLKGDTLGYRGPWGTTYPTNLRLTFGSRTEAQWLSYAKMLMTRPPMPWFNVRAMTDADLKAVYAYIKSLPGPAGPAAPAFLSPDKAPPQPFIQWPGVK